MKVNVTKIRRNMPKNKAYGKTNKNLESPAEIMTFVNIFTKEKNTIRSF